MRFFEQKIRFLTIEVNAYLKPCEALILLGFTKIENLTNFMFLIKKTSFFARFLHFFVIFCIFLSFFDFEANAYIKPCEVLILLGFTKIENSSDENLKNH